MPSGPNLGALLADYRIDSLLGRGGMGVVYLAEHLRLGRKVALKVLAPELAEDEKLVVRFVRESRMAASIDHPNIIPIYDAGEAQGVFYIAMRYVDGSDLGRLLREGPLEDSRMIAVLRQVASALDAAHTRGLVHRDVKPANVLVASGTGADSFDHVYLTDFGLTKPAASNSGLTAAGQFVGTINYVAPEQIEGGAVDGRTDEYALGCMLYECLTGRVPFVRDTELAVVFAHISHPPPAPSEQRPDLPRGMDAVIARAMSKQQSDRFPTCMEVIAAAQSAFLGWRTVEPTRVEPALPGDAQALPVIVLPEPDGPSEPDALREPTPQEPESDDAVVVLGEPATEPAPDAPVETIVEPLPAPEPGPALEEERVPRERPLASHPQAGSPRRPWWKRRRTILVAIAVAVVVATVAALVLPRSLPPVHAPATITQIVVMHRDGTGFTRLPDPEPEFAPSLSPDGTEVVFARQTTTGSELFVRNTDGSGTARQLTRDPGIHRATAWSPDGATIAYEVAFQGGSSIATIAAHGAGGPSLLTSGVVASRPSWTPKGQQILYEVDDTIAGPQVFGMKPDGSGQQPFPDPQSPKSGGSPVMSSDGSVIAVQVAARKNGIRNIYVVDAATGRRRNDVTPGIVDCADPMWIPGTLTLAFDCALPDGDRQLETVPGTESVPPPRRSLVPGRTMKGKNPSFDAKGDLVAFTGAFARATPSGSPSASGGPASRARHPLASVGMLPERASLRRQASGL